MKSAEHWEDVIGNIPGPDEGDPHGWEPYWEQLRVAIRAIQADALEAAALLVENATGDDTYGDPWTVAAEQIRKLKETPSYITPVEVVSREELLRRYPKKEQS